MANDEYAYVGRWCGPNGIATADLIAADWIITAPHVAENKIRKPASVDVTVCFTGPGGDISAKVVEAFERCRNPEYPWTEINLARLDRRIDDIQIIALAKDALSSGQEITIDIVGTTIKQRPILGGSCKLHDNGRYLIRTTNGNHQHANQNDSGGAWLIRQRNGGHVLVGIMQGLTDKSDPYSGAATQPAVRSEWINKQLADFGAKATWVAVDYR